jgi:hypothetical protein
MHVEGGNPIWRQPDIPVASGTPLKHRICWIDQARNGPNNASELGARAWVRKRAVSLGPRTEKGVRAWDTGMTIVETAKKLGVSVYEYIKDRLSGASRCPRSHRSSGKRQINCAWEHRGTLTRFPQIFETIPMSSLCDPST